MIANITEEQIKKMPNYVSDWVSKGLTTKQLTAEEAVNDFTQFQIKILKRDNPAPVVILDSPTECWQAVSISLNKRVLDQVASKVENQVSDQVVNQVSDKFIEQVDSQVSSKVSDQVVSKVYRQVRTQVWNQVVSQVNNQVVNQVASKVRNQVASQVVSQVRNQVVSQVVNQVVNQVASQVASQVDSQVDSQVVSQVRNQVVSQVVNQVASQVGSQVFDQFVSQVVSQVGEQVASQVNNQVRNQSFDQLKDGIYNIKFIYPYYNCQFWAYWFSFYEFCKNEFNIKLGENYEIFKQCQKYGMVFPLEDLCIVCQPPTQIHRNNFGLHNDTGPALSYNGQNEIYALNGVIMTKDQVMAPAEKLSVEEILKESNVEVRRELIRKIGIEMIFDRLPNKLLDKQGNYELYSINLSESVPDARYLKMVNPSIGCYHLEGVDPGVNTVKEAINWRASQFDGDVDWNPTELT